MDAYCRERICKNDLSREYYGLILKISGVPFVLCVRERLEYWGSNKARQGGME